MRWRALLVVGAMMVVVGVDADGALARKKKPPLPETCPGGRFPVGDALVPGGPAPDAVLIDGTQVSIDSGCAAVTARQRRTKRGTKLVARWKKGCGSLKGPVRLVALIDGATCETVTIRFKGRKVRRTLTVPIEVPPDAVGRNTDPVPDGVTMVEAEAWAALTQRDDFRSIGPAQEAADRAVEDGLAAEDAAILDDYFVDYAHLRHQLLGGVDPTDPNLATGDDGNLRLSRIDTTGAPQMVTTMGPKARRHWLAGLVKTFPTFTNQLRLYDLYYQSLAGIDPAFVSGLPTVTEAGQFSPGLLRDQNLSLVYNYGQYLDLIAIPPPGGTPPPGYPATCDGEERPGTGRDRAGGGACATPTAGGVWANRNWGLKFLNTCVRSQGMRGTCWAFTTAAAVETEVAKKHRRWINLSEQHLVFMTKHVWYPSVYGDNGGPPIDKILETSYRLPFEDQWDYNQSPSRTSNDTTRRYTNSCLGYGGPHVAFCSDTNHQGRIYCYNVLRWRLCGAVGPALSGHSGFAPTRWAYIWDTEDTDRAFANLVWAVGIFQKPVLLGFPVTPSFDAPDANGYVTFVGGHCVPADDGTCTPEMGCECDRGGHLALIVGLIDNTRLPAGAPMGAGGGYFIVKNSWGRCYGDAGYVYLPYDWVRLLAGWAAVIDVN